MSFWDLSDGGDAKDTGTEYEVPGGNMDPIPDGSSLLAAADEIKWDKDKDGNSYISLRWSVLSPDAYKNRKIFHKLWVTDFDPSAKDADKASKKRDKARRMLAAIDANAGGKLATKQGVPTDDDLAFAILNKPMVITVMVWSIDDRSTGQTVSGNWVCAVNPKTKEVEVKAAKPKPAARNDDFSSPSGGSSGGGVGGGFDDEIPFAMEWRI